MTRRLHHVARIAMYALATVLVAIVQIAAWVQISQTLTRMMDPSEGPWTGWLEAFSVVVLSLVLVATGAVSGKAKADEAIEQFRKRRRGRRSNRGTLPVALRFEILARDGHQCRYCGALATDGVKLHVDHVTPRARGGTDDPSNLVTACQHCNLGKGVRIYEAH